MSVPSCDIVCYGTAYRYNKDPEIHGQLPTPRSCWRYTRPCVAEGPHQHMAHAHPLDDENLMLRVFRFCGPATLRIASEVCRTWRVWLWAADDIIWHRWCENRWRGAGTAVSIHLKSFFHALHDLRLGFHALHEFPPLEKITLWRTRIEDAWPGLLAKCPNLSIDDAFQLHEMARLLHPSPWQWDSMPAPPLTRNRCW